MDSGGFDDVRFRFLEEPEPPREPRHRKHRRKAAAGAAAVLIVGALAAGTSALAGSSDDVGAGKPAAARSAEIKRDAAFGKPGHQCHRHDGAARFGAPSDTTKL